MIWSAEFSCYSKVWLRLCPTFCRSNHQMGILFFSRTKPFQYIWYYWCVITGYNIKWIKSLSNYQFLEFDVIKSTKIVSYRSWSIDSRGSLNKDSIRRPCQVKTPPDDCQDVYRVGLFSAGVLLGIFER